MCIIFSALERLCSCPPKFKQSSSTITILEESPTKSVQSPREEKLIPRPGFDLEDCPIVIDAPEDKKSSNTEKSQGNQELHTHSLKSKLLCEPYIIFYCSNMNV